MQVAVGIKTGSNRLLIHLRQRSDDTLHELQTKNGREQRWDYYTRRQVLMLTFVLYSTPISVYCIYCIYSLHLKVHVALHASSAW